MSWWTQEKEKELKDDYFPGLDPAQVSLKIFGRDDDSAIRSVTNKLSELKLRNKRGYDI